MAIKFTAIRLSGGTGHEHITQLWWVDPADGKVGNNSRAQLVAWIENQNGKAYVEDRWGNRSDVGVVVPRFGEKYLRSYANGVATDNLLALPRQ